MSHNCQVFIYHIQCFISSKFYLNTYSKSHGLRVNPMTFDIGLLLKGQIKIIEFSMGCILSTNHVITNNYEKHTKEVPLPPVTLDDRIYL